MKKSHFSFSLVCLAFQFSHCLLPQQNQLYKCGGGGSTQAKETQWCTCVFACIFLSLILFDRTRAPVCVLVRVCLYAFRLYAFRLHLIFSFSSFIPFRGWYTTSAYYLSLLVHTNFNSDPKFILCTLQPRDALSEPL